MDILQRDRFELVSAYLDGEVTASERQQVQEWLANDPEVKGMYSRLVMIRGGMQTLTVPQSQRSVQQTTQRVFAEIDRRQNKRRVVWGGAAIAALFVGAISSIAPGSRQPLLVVEAPAPAPAPLMVALNRPVIEIPKAAIAAPPEAVNSTLEKQ
ncbi:Fis family transcriptional regulator [Microcoleus sp. FACHB-831]|nr:Fis family transcriptional regulator [Microcoleus sp. FACHB-831]